MKLAASLILAENGLLSASNGNGDTATNRCGGVTYISNMTDSALETHAITLDDAARVVVGYATLDDVLMVRSSYDDTVLVPVLGQLQGVHAGEYGLCEEDSFVLSDSVQRTLVSTVNGIRIERVSELYDGYDQLLFTNETSTTMNSVPVVINNGDPVVIETLPAGETWTIAAVAEATVSIEGMEETPFEYNLDDDGNAIIIGYHGNDANLVIPAAINGHQVTEIDTWAFAECETIVSVEIPNNVTVISDFAFSDCTNLRFVTIGAGVSEFGSNVFRECISLEAFNVSNDNEWFASKEGVLFNKEITKLIVYPPDRNAREYSVPDGVAVINALAFNSCENLISVVLPNSIREIGDGAFGSCSNLECINIPRNTSRIGNSAFMFCSKLESVNIPDSVTEMGHSVFFMGGLVSLSIGSGLTEFGYGAFARCYDLVNVTLSEGIEIISSGSFANCKSMTSIIIPRSVKLIRDGAFYGCDTLSDIHFNGEAPEFTPEYIPGYEEDKPDEWYPTPITFYVPRDMGWEEWDAPEGVTVIFESDPQILELQAGWNWVSFQILPKDSHRVNDVISINGFTVNDFILTNSGSAHFNGTEWVPADFTIEYGRLYQINTSADVMVEIRGMPSEVLEVAVSSGWNWISNPTMTVVTPDLLIHTGGWSVGDRIQNGSGAFVTFNGTNWIPSNGLTLGPGDGCQLFTKNPGKIDFNK